MLSVTTGSVSASGLIPKSMGLIPQARGIALKSESVTAALLLEVQGSLSCEISGVNKCRADDFVCEDRKAELRTPFGDDVPTEWTRLEITIPKQRCVSDRRRCRVVPDIRCSTSRVLAGIVRILGPS